MSNFEALKQAANHKASLGRQKVYAKKAYVRTSELELIALLRERIQDTLDCFYRGTGEMSTVMKELRSCDALVCKRVEDIAKGKR